MKTIIMGAAGRDFHNFNVLFKNSGDEVVCFTAAQIPDIAGRKYPVELSGKKYPKGIPIYPEEELPLLIKKFNAKKVILSYSDLPNDDVMQKASVVNAAGADFVILNPFSTMLKSKKPVIAVCAVRTGCGKSQTTRYIAKELMKKSLKVAVVRHPMPYGDLAKQAVEKFDEMKDLDFYECTIEEREEYEPLINAGIVVFAGVDYEKILRKAEKEADVIIWDGGNNDTPFFFPDLMITVADALRPNHELLYYPGETNVRISDVVVINKCNAAEEKDIQSIEDNVARINPKARVIRADSIVSFETLLSVKGKKAVVVEDGPTVTHGGMSFGAGTVAAKVMRVRVISPVSYAAGSLKKTFEKYPHPKNILPAMGYYRKQIAELEKTINSMPIDVVISGTPVDLSKIIRSKKPIIRIRYELREKGKLAEIVGRFAGKLRG